MAFVMSKAPMRVLDVSSISQFFMFKKTLQL
jgi:hypothetical protein